MMRFFFLDLECCIPVQYSVLYDWIHYSQPLRRGSDIKAEEEEIDSHNHDVLYRAAPGFGRVFSQVVRATEMKV